ncbi:MAG: DKNYY domain-containing protein [Balneolaceae bacterium]|nr:DKNYY domain-containing protein [Balneolaceae bacterium]
MLISACKENGISLESAGLRGEVTGNWEPLDEGDTLEVYVHLNDQIHLGNPSFEITSLPEAHINTFQVWTDSNYARDSLHVYYPIETDCIVIDEQTVCYATEYIIENANSSTFRYLGNDYGTDGNELFFKGKVLRGSNDEGF